MVHDYKQHISTKNQLKSTIFSENDLISCEYQSIHFFITIIFIIIMNYYITQIRYNIKFNNDSIISTEAYRIITPSLQRQQDLQKIFKNLIHLLLHQFRSENYDDLMSMQLSISFSALLNKNQLNTHQLLTKINQWRLSPKFEIKK